jgi:hypothetical protein
MTFFGNHSHVAQMFRTIIMAWSTGPNHDAWLFNGRGKVSLWRPWRHIRCVTFALNYGKWSASYFDRFTSSQRAVDTHWLRGLQCREETFGLSKTLLAATGSGTKIPRWSSPHSYSYTKHTTRTPRLICITKIMLIPETFHLKAPPDFFILNVAFPSRHRMIDRFLNCTFC